MAESLQHQCLKGHAMRCQTSHASVRVLVCIATLHHCQPPSGTHSVGFLGVHLVIRHMLTTVAAKLI